MGRDRETNCATMADSVGGVWTIVPSDATPHHIDITAHTDEGPVTLCIPTCDAVSLAGRLRAVALAEVFGRFDRETDRLEEKPARPACDGTCGDCSDADTDASADGGAHVVAGGDLVDLFAHGGGPHVGEVS